MKSCKNILFLLALPSVLILSQSAECRADLVNWVDWTSSDGTSAFGDVAGINVTYTGELDPIPQTNGGTNYWAAGSSTYTASPIVDNPPPDSDIIRLTGLSPVPNVITFSKPVRDPVMAILSLGRLFVSVNYEFDAPFDVLNVGPGHFGNGTLVEISNNILVGREGHGLIQFQGEITSISWTVGGAEAWHGFTIGTTAVPEPGHAALLVFVGVALLSRMRVRNQPL